MSPPPAGAAATVEAARERSMSVSFPAITASVRKVRHALVTFARGAGATTDKIEAIRVVASEAATNVVAHAYNGVPGRIYVVASADSDSMSIVIADRGCGIVAGEGDLGTGLAVMREFSEAMTITSPLTGGLEVELRFSLN
jgi:anti-sigma regulatory factor (Ser/Thr protein kinase)